jgi:two-component system, chemotaxis family, protein-glutamate methylesterase/glutaminase
VVRRFPHRWCPVYSEVVAEPRDIVVIGGSAGAVEALSGLVASLPADLDAAVFVVVHTLPLGDSMLPAILSRKSALEAKVPADGERIDCKQIYVAPPDCHLLLEPGRIKLSSGPKESGHRPAIDPLFRTAANAYGDRVIGVILSGSLDDGSLGLRIIRRHGGTAIVQDPREALFPQMPRNAIDSAHPQHVARVSEIARLISNHTGRPVDGGEVVHRMSAAMIPDGDKAVVGAHDVAGTPTGIACPECHGVIWATDDQEAPEFRCRIGHAYSGESFLQAHSDSVEAALWAGVRALQEQASLSKHLAGRAQRRGDPLSAARLQERGKAADENATAIEGALLRRMPTAS